MNRISKANHFLNDWVTVLKLSNIKIFCRKKQIRSEDHRIIPSDYYSEINIGVRCADLV